MYIRNLSLLLVLFFFTKTTANPNAVFNPDFNAAPVSLPKGTRIIPLCNNPLDPLCINQWSNQALPLGVYQGNMGNIPQFQYFLPGFIPSGITAENPENDDNWEIFTPSFDFSYNRRRDRRRKKDSAPKVSTQKTAEKTDSPKEEVTQQTTATAGSPEEEATEQSTAKTDSRSEEEETGRITVQAKSPEESTSENIFTPSIDTEDQTMEFYRSTSNPDEIRVVETDKEGNQTIHEGRVAFVPIDDIEPAPVPPTARSEDLQEDRSTKADENIEELPSSPDTAVTASFQTKSATLALPATTREVQPGCFVIDKPEETTEAGFCADCLRDSEKEPVLSSLIGDREGEGFIGSVMRYLREVSSSASDKIASKGTGTSDSITKICSPETSLRAIINNFNRTCPEPYENNFGLFFEKAYCESCKKGVPPEIMMAMMSIESAGECKAESSNDYERSAGLFQVNSKVHQCRDLEKETVYRKNTPANLQCLKDPINNLNKGIDILVDHYNQVNPQALDTVQCKSWLEMKTSERDSWRRGVSAYNGGPKWVRRAIKSVRDSRTLQDTSYLVDSANSEYKTDEASWESLRVYYFTEKLSPTNTQRTGRRLDLTVSNLAHTEAVLGRNVKSSYPSMVEIWTQYIRSRKPSCE